MPRPRRTTRPAERDSPDAPRGTGARRVANPTRPSGSVRVDGRTMRGERNRGAIVDALFSLVGEGRLEPTAREIADRAGVGLRSVFRHFADRESLFAAMGERLFGEAAPIMLEPELRGGPEARARDLVERRCRFFEHVAPYKRSANLRRAESRFLQSRHEALVRHLRDDLLRRLPELRRAPTWLVDALDVATSFESWDRMRGDQALSGRRARVAMEATVLGLLRASNGGAAGRRA